MQEVNFLSPRGYGSHEEEIADIRYTHEFFCTRYIHRDACFASWIDFGPRSCDQRSCNSVAEEMLGPLDPHIATWHTQYASWFRMLFLEFHGHYLNKRFIRTDGSGAPGTIDHVVLQSVNEHFVNQVRKEWQDIRWIEFDVTWDDFGGGRLRASEFYDQDFGTGEIYPARFKFLE